LERDGRSLDIGVERVVGLRVLVTRERSFDGGDPRRRILREAGLRPTRRALGLFPVIGGAVARGLRIDRMLQADALEQTVEEARIRKLARRVDARTQLRRPREAIDDLFAHSSTRRTTSGIAIAGSGCVPSVIS